MEEAGLERDGLVSRRAFATVPVTVEYAITPLGRTLAETVDALRIWAESHIGEVAAAQRACLRTLTLDEIGADPGALGAAAVAALSDL